MWTTQHTEITRIPREVLWKAWSDVEHWPTWDEGLEWCQINTPFAKSARYTLKPVVCGLISECQRLTSFVEVSQLPLGFFFARVIDKESARDLPDTMPNLLHAAGGLA